MIELYITETLTQDRTLVLAGGNGYPKWMPFLLISDHWCRIQTNVRWMTTSVPSSAHYHCATATTNNSLDNIPQNCSTCTKNLTIYINTCLQCARVRVEFLQVGNIQAYDSNFSISSIGLPTSYQQYKPQRSRLHGPSLDSFIFSLVMQMGSIF